MHSKGYGWSWLFAITGSAVGSLAQAQTGTSAGPLGQSVTARIEVAQTATDNLRLNDQQKDFALITTVSPGISLFSNAGALRGSLDYSLSGVVYTKTDQAAQLQNALNASGTAELIPRSLFVDVRATIAQQATSAFGAQTSVPSLGSPNRSEVGTLSVSPYLTGQIAGMVGYELRDNYTRVQARGSSLGDSHSNASSLRLSGMSPGALNWWLLGSTQQSGYAVADGNRSSSLTAGVSYRPNQDLSFLIGGGRERADYLGNGQQTSSSVNGSIDWTPTPRTHVSADWQHHAYGDSHTLNVEHRMARSVWRFSDTQSLNLGNGGANNGLRTNYDQYYLLFASFEPDPVKRDLLVRSYLQTIGLSPDAPLATGFLLSGPSRMRNQLLSVTLQGARSNVTAMVSRNTTGRLGSNAVEGDLAASSRVQQLSYSLSASHQLTPVASLSLAISLLRTRGDLDSQATQLANYSLNWSARLGVRLSAQVGVRRSHFQSTLPYTENAVTASLSQQF